MKNAFVQFSFYDKNLRRLTTVPSKSILSASWIRTVGREGTAVIELPTKLIDFDMMTQHGLGMVIELATRTHSTPKPDQKTFWFLEKFTEGGAKEQLQTIRLTFKDAISILGNTIHAYKDNIPNGSSPFGNIISTPANTAIINLFRQNWGDLAQGYRNKTPYIGYENPSSLAPIINRTVSFKNVLSSMNQIARASRSLGTPLFFDFEVAYIGGQVQLVFKTYLNHRGVKRGADGFMRTLDPDFVLDSFTGNFDVPNRVFVGGSGRGVVRPVVREETTEANGIFTRNEKFASLQTGTIAEMETAAQAELNASAYIYQLKGNLVGRRAFQFGLGDVLTVEHRRTQYPCEITSIRTQLDNELLTRRLLIASRGE